MARGDIQWIPDVGGPAIVTAVHIAAQKVPLIAGFKVADFSGPELADYAMTLGGYAAAWFGWGGSSDMGKTLKNIGIASLPLSAIRLYNRVSSGATGFKPVTRSVNRIAHIGGEVPTDGGMRGTLG